MRVAIIGGGLTGACAALELAECGCSVDILEAGSTLVSKASFWNEGKIHLGFVYAKDASAKTAWLMIRGALRFRPLMCRWIDSASIDAALSSPFHYAVHRDGMLQPAAIRTHFARVKDLFDAELRLPGRSYLAPAEGPLWRLLDDRERKEVYDGTLIDEVYLTGERSIDPRRVAGEIGKAVSRAARVNALTGATVTAVSIGDKSKVTVCFTRDGHRHRETYDQVVNASWQNRLAIDATAGLDVSRRVIHRYKVALHETGAYAGPAVPSTTFIVGCFGDTVSFADRTYLSWYPSGNILTSTALRPPAHPPDIVPFDEGTMIASTTRELSRLIPSHRRHLEDASRRWLIGGGYITAWGSTGIEDPHSRLHERYQVGITSRGPYHSVDTGKYTLAPLLAHETCARILRSQTIPLRRPSQAVRRLRRAA
jgi:glycine/D-amino acid oxidase-like deaminating enzyme